jgi:hypothetical protein
MTNKKKKQQPIHDSHDEYGFSEGVMTMGMGTLDMSYDVGQLDLFSEDEMKDKYPALKQAWEHYQSILEVCKTKEKEESQ